VRPARNLLILGAADKKKVESSTYEEGVGYLPLHKVKMEGGPERKVEIIYQVSKAETVK
jgi:predicted DNA-binding antitoxin AbrB/MazE fold protein